MADGTSHPFNHNVIADDTIAQLQQQLSRQQQQNILKHHQYKDLIDLLAWNNTSNHFLNSIDSSISISSHSVNEDDFNRLKYVVRSAIWPVDYRIRRQLWMNILTLNRFNSSKQNHRTHNSSQTALTTASMILDDSLGSASLKYQWPNFVDKTNLCFYHLTEPTGRLILQRILLSFVLHHPDITYCPSLEPFAALLLHYHTDYEVLYLINRLLIKNWLLGGTRLQWEANCNVFKKLSRLYYKSAADMIDVHYTNTKPFYQEWFWWIFRYLPLSYVVKIMDCFFLEGPKVLYRISLALVHLFAKTIKHDSDRNTHQMADFCQQIPVSIDRLLHASIQKSIEIVSRRSLVIAFHIRNLKRRTIDQLIEQEEKLLHSTCRQLPTDDVNQNGTIPDRSSALITPQQLTRIPKNSILNHEQFLTLWNWLPPRLSISQPALVFTTEEHGFRLQTLLNKIDELEYSILIIKATNGEIFGAFCAGLWSDRRNRAYFGFGESFLFTLISKQMKYPWVGQQQDNDNRQNQVKRELFLFVNNEKLIIGGGHGEGICIDQSLCEGRTTHCETFNNEPLCSQSDFSISVLEMIDFDFSSS